MSHLSLERLIFSAMRNLPVPILVLNNTKTVVYANEAIGTLLGIARHARDDNFEDFSDVQMKLRGQTLCQVGVDMLQDGRLMWVSWDDFLDSIAKELRVNSGMKRGVRGGQGQTAWPASHSTADSGGAHGRDGPTLAPSPTQDIAVDVVICGNDLTRMSGDPTEIVGACEHQIHATMIVSAWEFADHQTYFTLTFTRSQPAPVSLDAVGRGSTLDSAEPVTRPGLHESVAPKRDVAVWKSTHFPPAGPPSKSVRNAPLSQLQKITKMKDVLLNSTEIPVLAMWKDGSAVFPNRASRKLCRQDACFDDALKGRASLQNWDTYTWDFSRKLSLDELPISILLDTEEPFGRMRIGIYDKSGRRLVCDARGELIRDEAGEVFAGLVTMTDVTRFAEEISEIKEHGEERFKQICNTMPQLVWTTTGDAKFDFFNIRWYEYTGLSFDLSVGDRWTTVLHPDDRAAVLEKWEYCMRTGEAYAADYRVRNSKGEYRWFLARANPLRDRETGQILKWFGTSTDVHETMEASFAAKRMRQQLSTVITHCRVTLFTVDTKRRISMLEGALVRDAADNGSPGAESQGRSDWYIGENVYEVFSRLGAGEKMDFLQPIEDVFAGKTAKGAREYNIRESCRSPGLALSANVSCH
jgi:PAS domain S-box-containing protein